jgi:heat shock protein HtpX
MVAVVRLGKRESEMNYFKTFILLFGMAVLLMVIGHLIGGQIGVIVALGIAVVLNFTSWYYSDKIVLTMYRAQEVDESSAPNLYRIVRGLAQEAGLPMPKVYIVPSQSPNAFATGRDPKHAAVAATQGILNLLSHDELKAVLAHEMAHVKNRDSLVMTVAATLAAAIGLLAYFARWAAIFGMGGRRGGGGIIALLIWSILAPIIALIIQLAISRTREYGADRGGAEISAQPLMLASALRKISDYSTMRPQQDLANPATAHMWIASPFSGGMLRSLFSTHPPVEERIRRLEKMAGM